MAVYAPHTEPDSDSLVTYNEGYAGLESGVNCPSCGGQNEGYLHLESVTFWRSAKDFVKIDKEVTMGELLDGSGSPSYNANEGRNGLVAEFSCELCGEKPELRIGNHKGHCGIWWGKSGTAM